MLIRSKKTNQIYEVMGDTKVEEGFEIIEQEQPFAPGGGNGITRDKNASSKSKKANAKKAISVATHPEELESKEESETPAESSELDTPSTDSTERSDDGEE